MVLAQFDTMRIASKPFSTLVIVLSPLGLCCFLAVQYSMWIAHGNKTVYNNDAFDPSSAANRHEIVARIVKVDDPRIVWLASFPNSGEC